MLKPYITTGHLFYVFGINAFALALCNGKIISCNLTEPGTFYNRDELEYTAIVVHIDGENIFINSYLEARKLANNKVRKLTDEETDRVEKYLGGEDLFLKKIS